MSQRFLNVPDEPPAPTWPAAEMMALAEELRERFAPVCYRCIVVGSLRRLRTYVKDIELLCQPFMLEPQSSLFEVPEARADKEKAESEVYRLIQAGLKDGTFAPRMNRAGNPIGVGRKTAYLVFKGRPFDCFSALPGQSFGVKCAIYTGPRDFSKKLVTAENRGGYLPRGWKVEGGRLFDEHGRDIVCDTEEEFFKALGLDYIAPEFRMQRP